MSKFAFAAILVLPFTAANASTFTQVVNLPVFDPYYGQVYDQNIPAFDTSLGTLTSLNVEVRVSFSESLPVETTSHLPFTYTSATFLTHASASIDGSIYTTAPSTSQIGRISINGSMPDTGTASVGGNFDFNVSADPYTAYYDPPTVEVDVSATIPSGSSFSQPEDSQSVQAGGTLTLTYTYTAVPEPISIAIVVPAIIGALGVRRRRRIITS